MRGSNESYTEQREATFREYTAAVEAGLTEKANAIKEANPDIDFTTKATEV